MIQILTQQLLRWVQSYHNWIKWWPQLWKSHSNCNKPELSLNITWSSIKQLHNWMAPFHLVITLKLQLIKFALMSQIAEITSLCKFACVCMCINVWKEQAIYSLCIPGDLSLKLHIHDTSLWGLEGHHQIEGLTSAGTHTHPHTQKVTQTHTLSSSLTPESTAYTLSRKFFTYFWRKCLSSLHAHL